MADHQGKRLIFFINKNGKRQPKYVPITPIGELQDLLPTLSNWQASYIYYSLLGKKIPNNLMLADIPNEKYLDNPTYGPGWKKAITNLIKSGEAINISNTLQLIATIKAKDEIYTDELMKAIAPAIIPEGLSGTKLINYLESLYYPPLFRSN